MNDIEIEIDNVAAKVVNIFTTVCPIKTPAVFITPSSLFHLKFLSQE